MPVKDIIQHAMDNNPLKMQQAFDDEMKGRVRNALNQKYQDMTADAVAASESEEIVDEIPETPDLEAYEFGPEESVEETTEED